MKILAFMNGYSQGVSGGDRVFVKIVSHLKNIDWTIVTSHNGKRFCEEFKLQARYMITSREKIFQHVMWVYLQRILRALFYKYPNDITAVYSSSDSLPDVFPSCVIAMKAHLPWIARTYHIVPSDRVISRVSQEISILLMKWKATKILTASKIMQKELTRRGIQDRRIEVIYPGIDKKPYTKILDRSFDAAWMSRIHKSKGIEDVILIWKEVLKTYPLSKLALFGTGETKYVNRLKELIHENNLDESVTYFGYQPDHIAFGTIRSSKVFLHTSHEEGFGMVVAEVLACNIPVVSYDLPIFDELFTPFRQAVRVKSFDQFADKVCGFLKLKKSSKGTLKQSESLLNTFSWHHAARHEYNVIYETLSHI